VFGIERKGQRIGFATSNMSVAVTQLQQYIEDHIKSEAGQLQLRLWNETKKTILFSEAEAIARENLEEQLKIVEFA
jgi:hypothetical protein